MILSILVNFDPLIHESVTSKLRYFYLPVILLAALFSFTYWRTIGRACMIKENLAAILVPNWSNSRAVHLKGLIQLLYRVLVMILTFNILRLLPYTLGFTGQLWLVITLAFPLWLSLILSGWWKSAMTAAASLVPQGAPMALGPLVAILETIRLLVRPVSLRLRLVVNISAGHLLLSLIRQFIVSITFSSPLRAFLLILIEIGYLMLEIGISFIQAYIFTTLLSLYANDHPEN